MKDLPAYSWMFLIFKGYENKNLNYEHNDKDKKRDFSEDRRLTLA